MTFDITINEIDITAEIEDNHIDITVNGEWAGSGTLHNGRIEDCAAPLGEDVYEAIEAEIKAAL